MRNWLSLLLCLSFMTLMYLPPGQGAKAMFEEMMRKKKGGTALVHVDPAVEKTEVHIGAVSASVDTSGVTALYGVTPDNIVKLVRKVFLRPDAELILIDELARLGPDFVLMPVREVTKERKTLSSEDLDHNRNAVSHNGRIQGILDRLNHDIFTPIKTLRDAHKREHPDDAFDWDAAGLTRLSAAFVASLSEIGSAVSATTSVPRPPVPPTPPGKLDALKKALGDLKVKLQALGARLGVLKRPR